MTTTITELAAAFRTAEKTKYRFADNNLEPVVGSPGYDAWDAEYRRLEGIGSDFADRLYATPAQTPAEAATKLRVLLEEVSNVVDTEWWGPHLRQLIAELEAMDA